ncbi:uncharacterized protein LOC111332021 [Stylophora pistillata]|uniref:uncharacterized protein LOC111332021 n=1 Tax=Stylophora pistillata TaxID=50429 RepID=UPI000C04DC8C|nr:uncharacterized protein LOC111332021 [Stylophora pistillata]
MGLGTCHSSGHWIELDNWTKINSDPVCFGTKDNDYGSFAIQEAGQIYTFKLVHTSGSVTCVTNLESTKWGCSYSDYGDYNLMTVMTYRNGVLQLAEFVRNINEYRYQLDGFDVNSPTLVFNLLPTPLSVSRYQEFQVWYGQDLAGFTEENNAGETCTDVYALYPLN